MEPEVVSPVEVNISEGLKWYNSLYERIKCTLDLLFF